MKLSQLSMELELFEYSKTGFECEKLMLESEHILKTMDMIINVDRIKSTDMYYREGYLFETGTTEDIYLLEQLFYEKQENFIVRFFKWVKTQITKLIPFMNKVSGNTASIKEVSDEEAEKIILDTATHIGGGGGSYSSVSNNSDEVKVAVDEVVDELTNIEIPNMNTDDHENNTSGENNRVNDDGASTTPEVKTNDVQDQPIHKPGKPAIDDQSKTISELLVEFKAKKGDFIESMKTDDKSWVTSAVSVNTRLIVAKNLLELIDNITNIKTIEPIFVTKLDEHRRTIRKFMSTIEELLATFKVSGVSHKEGQIIIDGISHIRSIANNPSDVLFGSNIGSASVELAEQNKMLVDLINNALQTGKWDDKSKTALWSKLKAGHNNKFECYLTNINKFKSSTTFNNKTDIAIVKSAINEFNQTVTGNQRIRDILINNADVESLKGIIDSHIFVSDVYVGAAEKSNEKIISVLKEIEALVNTKTQQKSERDKIMDEMRICKELIHDYSNMNTKTANAVDTCADNISAIIKKEAIADDTINNATWTKLQQEIANVSRIIKNMESGIDRSVMDQNNKIIKDNKEIMELLKKYLNDYTMLVKFSNAYNNLFQEKTT